MIFIDEEKYKNKIGIYGIKNTINNNIYIGKTAQNFLRRYWHHKWKLNNGSHDNRHLQNSWNKYGEENFIYFVIDVVNDERYLNYLEKYYIRYYRAKKCCFNISDGGDGKSGQPMSNSAKEIIGKKNRQHMLGKKHSKETKTKMSEARTGKYYKRSTDVINEELAIKIKTKLINNEHPSEIANELNIRYGIINNILSNNTWSHVKVDGWDEWRTSRKTYTRLSKKDHEKIYKLYKSNKYTKYELAELYGKGVKMIEKILRDQRELHGNPVPSQ